MTVEKWCYWQLKAKEDTDETWTCGAHLAEACVFRCGFQCSDIDPEINLPRVKSSAGCCDGVCRDYQPIHT